MKMEPCVLLSEPPLWVGRRRSPRFVLISRFSSDLFALHSLYQESPRQTKPKKGQFMNFSRGILEQKFDVNRACFPKEKHRNSQKWAKFMNFSLWPFLWFGLPGRRLIVRTLFSGMPRFAPVCSDLLRFLPICFQNKSEQIRETPFCRPLLQVPDFVFPNPSNFRASFRVRLGRLPFKIPEVPEGHHPRGQPSARLSEEICLAEGFSEASAGVFPRVLPGSAGLCRGPRDFLRFLGVVTLNYTAPESVEFCYRHGFHCPYRFPAFFWLRKTSVSEPSP